MPDAPVHAGSVNTYEDLVASDLGLADVPELEDLR
jgi:hypothetical protein